jgi:hypothetical protein
MSPTFAEIRLKNFKEDLEKLYIDYKGVADKKRRESNPQEQNNLQLQLDSIANEIKEKEQEIEKIKNEAKENKIKELQEILSQITTKEENAVIKRAHSLCSPKGWEYSPTDKPEEILADVVKMRQGDSEYTRVEHFVACLITLIKHDSSLVSQLKEWAKYIGDEKISDLLNQAKKSLEKKRKNANPYLLMILEKSNQDSASNNSDCYRIQASYIPDIENYKYNHENKTCDGCKLLDLREYENQTFTIDKIPDVLNDILNRNIDYDYDSYENLTIEIFLPFDLLNHPVDCWEYKDGTDFLPISSPTTGFGQKYKVAVRSYERWNQLYEKNQYRFSWEKNWRQLKDLNFRDFSLGSNDIVNEIIGLKVVKTDEKNDTFFAKIIKCAIPVALSLRQNPPNLDCQFEIKQILNTCSCIHDLPVTIKDKRIEAQDPNTNIGHLGHHISLLWEDPYRLPPKIKYFM